ncbi:excinuclease ABC subunit UvrA [Arthrobacter globiformis]|uniref:excinuclease ABC subunit UvrA n=1 Tax=Arthrobacter globiformis TaxID=1665 RepID=UPI00279366BF|nr:excinuclease ABC subunit UvrA [Arthrobacter globiformis]MDQ0617219.1 excinuclease ABC subunit A [Arthrobacter globiformis]
MRTEEYADPLDDLDWSLETGTGAHHSADGFVRVRGARENNLRNVDVAVPRDAIVAFTGVSGSGKSSLAFGTIYAEAQRRYFESVAPYARRLIQQGHNPKVEMITGLPPAVALQQRRGTPSSRSTVGTVTTLSNSLRMLFSRAGSYPAGASPLDSDAFSPNTAAGACPECHGLGVAHTVTEASLVPDPSLSIREGAVAAWPTAWQGKNLRDILTHLGYDVDTPWRELPRKDRDWILFTDEQPVVEITPQRDRVAKPYKGKFWSAKSHVLHTLADSKSNTMRERVLRFMETGPCQRCSGSGLTPEALAVTFAGRTIAELNAVPMAELADIIRPTTELKDAGTASRKLSSGEDNEVAVAVTRDLLQRITVLLDLGLGYLALGRSTPTLSPGEMQRLRIATQLRSGLFGVVYVLDEPSAGLHPADAEPLLAVLEQLKSSGNSVFVVEHNMDIVRRADWLVDVGPRAGEGGGEVLYSGPVAGLAAVEASVTRPFLVPDGSRGGADDGGITGGGDRTAGTGEPDSSVRTGRRREPSAWLELKDISRHNLRGLDAAFPLQVLTAVTGVSGSGKSTLVSHVLAEVVGSELHGNGEGADAAATELTGAELTGTNEDQPMVDGGPGGPLSVGIVTGLHHVDRLVTVDQKPIGRTPRSNLATYTGLFDAVRKEFAATDEARARRYGAGRFSFNVAGGRCETCQGEGFVAVELLFLPGSYGPCPECGGSRYNPETLEITYRGKTVADVLGMTVDAATEFLQDVPAAARSLQTLREVGLGYLRLGQPATELSGGEAQRIKLATELQRARRGHTLYLLDEPTTGLHPADVRLLMAQLQRLVDAGNTVVVVEHEMDVVAEADWVVDLGPAGGDAGGEIVAAGTPAAVAGSPDSRTAPYLASALNFPSVR